MIYMNGLRYQSIKRVDWLTHLVLHPVVVDVVLDFALVLCDQFALEFAAWKLATIVKNGDFKLWSCGLWCAFEKPHDLTRPYTIKTYHRMGCTWMGASTACSRRRAQRQWHPTRETTFACDSFIYWINIIISPILCDSCTAGDQTHNFVWFLSRNKRQMTTHQHAL